jgi:hypothetical protein
MKKKIECRLHCHFHLEQHFQYSNFELQYTDAAFNRFFLKFLYSIVLKSNF